MNWEMVGAIGEVFGALAVVLTLFYLARQVRESSDQDRRHQAMELSRIALRNTDSFARDPALADIWLRGMRGSELLDDAETVRFGSIIYNILQAQEIHFHFTREGGLHDYSLESARSAMKDVVATPGVQEWWAYRKHWFSPDFQAEVERCIAEGPARSSFLERYDEGTS